MVMLSEISKSETFSVRGRAADREAARAPPAHRMPAARDTWATVAVPL
eukprot:SAG31_NODE_1702_length_7496_cov_2.367311_7_plen_48_part_00